jgi:DNA primase
MIASVSILDEVLRVATVDDILRLAGVAVPENAKKPLLCPLHGERSPSFYRQRSGKGYRCQGCGAHGGVLELATALKLAPTRPKSRRTACRSLRARKGP